VLSCSEVLFGDTLDPVPTRGCLQVLPPGHTTLMAGHRAAMTPSVFSNSMALQWSMLYGLVSSWLSLASLHARLNAPLHGTIVNHTLLCNTRFSSPSPRTGPCCVALEEGVRF